MTKITLDCRKAIVLDWNDFTHWNGGKQTPCIHCGRPALLLDDSPPTSTQGLRTSGTRRTDQQTERKTCSMTSIEARVRAITKPERTAYLREHGWYRLSYSGSQTWFSPGWTRDAYGAVDPPEQDRCFYSLAAAIRMSPTCLLLLHVPRSWDA